MGLKPCTSDFTFQTRKADLSIRQAVDVGWIVETPVGIILDIREGSKPKANTSACTQYMRLCLTLDDFPEHKIPAGRLSRTVDFLTICNSTLESHVGIALQYKINSRCKYSA